jgi:glycosyltransferase involved in cell wall biosynthesis
MKMSEIEEKLTLVYNNPDPGAGGIPRYANRIIKGLEKENIDFSSVDFTHISGDSTFEKVKNLIWTRPRFIQRQKKNMGGVNFFVQPELYFKTPGTDIVTVHDLFMKYYNGGEGLYDTFRHKIYNIRFDRAINNADHFITVSTQTKRQLIEEGVKEERISVINLGVREKFSQEENWEERENKIGYLGDFRPRKNVGRLLQDFAENSEDLGDFQLVLGGGGGSEEEILKEKYSGKERIKFQGRVPEEELTNWYNSLKAFFFPSELEGFGLPVLEAVSCGTPVFIYKDAEIPQEVKEYCITVESVSEVPEKLDELSDEKVQEKAGEISREFDWDKTVSETVDLIENI